MSICCTATAAGSAKFTWPVCTMTVSLSLVYYLAIVTLQIDCVLKGGSGVYVDDVAIDSSKHVTTITKSTLHNKGKMTQ